MEMVARQVDFSPHTQPPTLMSTYFSRCHILILIFKVTPDLAKRERSGTLPAEAPTEKSTIDHPYNVTKRLVSLQTGAVLMEEYNVTVNSEELIGTAEYLTLLGEVSYKPMSL